MANRKPKTGKLKIIDARKAGSINIHKKADVEHTIFKSCVIDCIELMKEGYSNLYIKEWIKKTKKGSTSERVIEDIITLAHKEIVRSQYVKAQEIIPIHIDRYNKQIKRLLETKEIDESEIDGEFITWEDFWKARNKKIMAFSDCINTMIQKEKLLQFHNSDFVIDWNTEEEITIKEKKKGIDIHKLTFEEQVELLNMFKKGRVDQDELLGVVTTSEETTVTEDVKHEVIELPNITHIKQEKLPEPLQRSPVTASDPTVKLRETLAKIAAKEFKKVGGNLTEEEEKLID